MPNCLFCGNFSSHKFCSCLCSHRYHSFKKNGKLPKERCGNCGIKIDKYVFCSSKCRIEYYKTKPRTKIKPTSYNLQPNTRIKLSIPNYTRVYFGIPEEQIK